MRVVLTVCALCADLRDGTHCRECGERLDRRLFVDHEELELLADLDEADAPNPGLQSHD